MTIQEAIRLLQNSLDKETILISTDELKALKLGFEALKREQGIRRRLLPGLEILYPGETEE